MVWIGIVLTIIMFIGLITAVEKLKYNEFNDVSWAYISFGMYTWFQVLTLVPFWFIFSLGCIFLWTPAAALKAYLIYHALRSLVEIIMIQNSHESEYINKVIPMLQKFSPSLPKQMFCLVQFCIAVTCCYSLSGLFF